MATDLVPSSRVFGAIRQLSDPAFLLELACLVVSLDIFLSLLYGVPIYAVTFQWFQSTVPLGSTLLFVLAYAFSRSLVFPLLLAAYTLAIFHVLSNSFLASKEVKQSVSWDTWTDYAILTRNVPAYREVEAHRKRIGEGVTAMRASFSLLLLLVANSCLGMGIRETALSSFRLSLQEAPEPWTWIGWIITGGFFAILLVGGLVPPIRAQELYGFKTATELLHATVTARLKRT